jgi:hypothetical protein
VLLSFAMTNEEKQTNKKLCSISIYQALERNENEDWKVERDKVKSRN